MAATVRVDDGTAALLRFAAAVYGMSVSQVIALAVRLDEDRSLPSRIARRGPRHGRRPRCRVRPPLRPPRGRLD